MKHFLKQIGFALCVIGIVYGSLEASSYGLYYFLYGEAFSFAEVRKQLGEQTNSPLVPRQAIAETGTVLAHLHNHNNNEYILNPYTGWVRSEQALPDPRLRERGEINYQISPYGYWAEEDPIEASKDKGNVIVGITGASVAEKLFLNRPEREVIRSYVAKLPGYKDRKIIFAMLCTGTYKQPQQVMSIAYYLAQHGRLDVLINIDGKNEATGTYVNQINEEYPLYPSLWDSFFPSSFNAEKLALLGDITMWKNIRFYTADSFVHVDFSVTALTFWTLVDHYINVKTVNAQSKISSNKNKGSSYFITGPDVYKDASPEAFMHLQLHVWEDGAKQLQYLANGNHFKYFQFLQPTPYRYKPLSSEEKAKIYDGNSIDARTVKMFYPQMEAEVPKLRAQGVNVYDFTKLFENNNDTIYRDSCCHLNTAGEDILAHAIGEKLLLQDAPGIAADATIPAEEKDAPVASDTATAQ